MAGRHGTRMARARRRRRAENEAAALRSRSAERRSPCPMPTGRSARSPESAITSAARWAKVVATTRATSSARGTTGSSTASPAKASPDSRPIAFRATSSRRRAVGSSSTSIRSRRATSCRTIRTRSRGRSSASRAACGCSASRPPRWTLPFRGIRPRTRCSTSRSSMPRQALDCETRLIRDPRPRLSPLRGVLLEERRRPARGPARSRRWTRDDQMDRSTKGSSFGRTRSSSLRRSVGAPRARSTSR